MSNIGDLIKVTLIEDYKLNKIFKKNNILKIILVSLLSILVVSSVSFLLGLTYYNAFITSDPNNSVKTLVTLSLVSSSLVLIITNLTKVSAYLFRSNDFEMLMSMPISTKEIILSKIFSLLISNYLVILLTTIPAYIVLSLNINLRPSFYFDYTVAILFLPLLIISIIALISYILDYIFSKIKIKTFVQIALGIISISLYMIFVIGSSSNDNPTLIYELLLDKLKYVYYPAIIAVNGIMSNKLYLLLYIFLNVLGFYLFIKIVAKYYLKINTNKLDKTSSNKKVKKQIKNESNILTITKFELKKYFSSTNYVLNTIIGKILFPIFVVSISFSLKNIDEDLSVLSSFFSLIIMALSIFSLTMTSTTTSTISLEGKNIWFYKQLPIKSSNIFISKILVDFIISILIGIPTIIISIFLYKINIYEAIFLIIFIILISIYNSSLGLLINLKFPKLDWDLEIKAIKQSLSVFLHMILSFLLIGILIALGILFFKFSSNIYLLMILINILFIIFNFIIYTILKINGNKWFLKL